MKKILLGFLAYSSLLANLAGFFSTPVLAADNFSIQFGGAVISDYDYNQFTALDIVGNDQLTIEFWVNPTSYTVGGNNSVYAAKTLNGPDPSPYNIFIHGLFEADQNIITRLYDDSNPEIYLDSGVNFNLDTWYHYALVKASSSLWTIYINGVEVTSTDQDIVNTQTLDGITLGATDEGGSVTNFGNEKLDEVRVWDVALTSQQILDNYQCEIDPTTPHLLAYYQFENDSLDSTANAYDLTEVNSPTFSSDHAPVLDCGATAPSLFDRFWNRYNVILSEIGAIGLIFGTILGIIKLFKEHGEWWRKNSF